jgi:hypothetical protein
MRKDVKASKKYWFVWDEELGNPCAFDAFLFNDPDHLALQPCKNRYSYYLIKKHDEVIYARCTFFIENNVAYSPYRGSFGSIEFSDKVFFELLEEYWEYLEVDLRERGVKEIFIKNYPVCYNPSHAQMLSFLFSTKGFAIKTQELNFHIEVDERGFEEKLHASEKNKLNRCLKKSYEFQEETNSMERKKLIHFNKDAKERKKIPITLKSLDLEKYLIAFPNQYIFFSLRFKGDLAALILIIGINRQILYTFYNADHIDFLKDSPLILLHKEIYHYAQNNGYRFIDFGIGSEQGLPNKGLIRFKEKMGETSIKISFLKDLNL